MFFAVSFLLHGCEPDRGGYSIKQSIVVAAEVAEEVGCTWLLDDAGLLIGEDELTLELSLDVGEGVLKSVSGDEAVFAQVEYERLHVRMEPRRRAGIGMKAVITPDGMYNLSVYERSGDGSRTDLPSRAFDARAVASTIDAKDLMEGSKQFCVRFSVVGVRRGRPFVLDAAYRK